MYLNLIWQICIQNVYLTTTLWPFLMYYRKYAFKWIFYITRIIDDY